MLGFKKQEPPKTIYEQLMQKFNEDTEYYQRQIQSLEEQKRKLKGGEQMAFKPINKEQIKSEPIEFEKPKPKAEPKEEIEIVDKLPTQEVPIRKYKREDGTIVNLMTVAEYLTTQANE